MCWSPASWTAPEVSYAMFSGGGASWAEAEMKAGRFAVPAAPPGTRPDLTGLSCRWDPIAAHNGDIVSVIACRLEGPIPGTSRNWSRRSSRLSPGSRARAIRFRLKVLMRAWIPPGLDFEARASSPWGGRFWRKLGILVQVVVLKVTDAFGLTLGRFDPRLYRADVVQNSDFRKFDDGLKLTVDIDAARLARLERLLDEARRDGVCHFGLHRQKDALMTCIVPSPLTRDHLHFVDGAAGGYAMAAVGSRPPAPQRLSRRRSAALPPPCQACGGDQASRRCQNQWRIFSHTLSFSAASSMP